MKWIVIVMMITFTSIKAQTLNVFIASGNQIDSKNQSYMNQQALFEINNWMTIPTNSEAAQIGGTLLPIEPSNGYFRNRFEIKAGFEFTRGLPEGVIGLNWRLNERFSIVPEIGVILGPIVSGSVRHLLPLKNKIDLYVQAGLGKIFMGSNCFEYAIGMDSKLLNDIRFQVEVRGLYFENNAENRNVSLQGKGIVKQMPIVLFVGVSF